MYKLYDRYNCITKYFVNWQYALKQSIADDLSLFWLLLENSQVNATLLAVCLINL